ncbi:hypothetical protein DERF_011152 [Dermatophagoides farinae]|uniref:Uncharacterized protein n=1 Tax=Dermatophagoides farinae TaxID=6954 RepID=A0A922HU12_DERFA|nr:hypothetical protein DERF_011152 [Dermatophagoides farinae]
MFKTNPLPNIHRYYHLEKFRKAKTEDCKQAIPSTAWTIDQQQQQQQTIDMNNPNKIMTQNQDEQQQQQQQQKWQMFELNKDILVRHRPPHKFRNEQNYHHIFIPKQRQLFSVIREINDDSDAGRGHYFN